MKYSMTVGIFAALLLSLGGAHAQERKANPHPAAENVPATSRHNATGDTILQNGTKDATQQTRYRYEFKQPDFTVSSVRIEHDAIGAGQMTFTKRDAGEALTEPIQLSPAALERIVALWTKLDFLRSQIDYQAEKQFPHLGTMTLSMSDGEHARTAAFNWTKDPDALALVNEYKRLTDQTLFIFDITVARENQPLEAPALMKRLATLVQRQGVSDAAQLIPLLRDLSTDERLPLIARNEASKLLKKLDK